MKPGRSIPVPVLRAREIHRAARMPKVSTVLDLGAVPVNMKARVVFQKMREINARRPR